MTIDTLFPAPKKQNNNRNSTINTNNNPVVSKSPEKFLEKIPERKEEVKVEAGDTSQIEKTERIEKPEEPKKTEGLETITKSPEAVTTKPDEIIDGSLQSSRSVEVEENPNKKKAPSASNLTFKVDGYPDDEIMW